MKVIFSHFWGAVYTVTTRVELNYLSLGMFFKEDMKLLSSSESSFGKSLISYTIDSDNGSENF